MDWKYICQECKVEFDSYYKKTGKRIFCTRSCATKGNSGSKNPNFGNKWNKEQRQVASERVKEEMKSIERRFVSGSGNRGVKFDKERIAKMHSNRNTASYSHPHSQETREIIGKKSKEKFTIEYKIRIRKTGEENGTIIRLEEKNDFDFYNTLSNWVSRMFDKIEDKSQLKLLTELGVFSKTNGTGVMRDHIFSRKDGFKGDVFPELLRHPVNCQILTSRENGKKRSKSYQTLEELFHKILNFKGDWFEQDLCLKKIQEYKEGKRYIKENYIIQYYATVKKY